MLNDEKIEDDSIFLTGLTQTKVSHHTVEFL